MVPNKEAILELMECFTEATGIGLYCLDQSMEMQPFSTARWTPDELESLELADVSWHLWKQTRGGPAKRVIKASLPETGHESFITRSGLHYLISTIPASLSAGRPDCYLVTEPLVTRPIDAKDDRLAKVRRVSSRRADQLGKTLDHLCKSFHIVKSGSRTIIFKEKPPTAQPVHDGRFPCSESAYAFARKILPS